MPPVLTANAEVGNCPSNHYANLEDYALSTLAADAARELSGSVDDDVAPHDFSAERLADLLGACSSALRRVPGSRSRQVMAGHWWRSSFFAVTRALANPKRLS